MTNFIQRYGYAPEDPPITVREDAPLALRNAVWHFAIRAGMHENHLSRTLTAVLPDTAFDNNMEPGEAGDYILRTCPWPYVYEMIECIHEALQATDKETYPRAPRFADALNGYFRRNGIGWQIVDGKVEIRGPETLDVTVRAAIQALREDGKGTAENELHEALTDLSRRPDADLTGAVTHAGAALECVARDVSGDSKKTLGELIKEHPEMFPAPLDKIAHGVWAIASNKGRHLNEGAQPSKREAILLVGLAASISAYLIERD